MVSTVFIGELFCILVEILFVYLTDVTKKAEGLHQQSLRIKALDSFLSHQAGGNDVVAQRLCIEAKQPTVLIHLRLQRL